MTLEAEIQDFLTNVGNNHQIFKYLYNTTPDTFVPFETPVYYSGPYWDNKEIIAMMKAILEGKWITSGEMVHKFEAQFSKKFKLNHSVMVNSGSSANLALIGAVKKYLEWQDGDEIILSVVGFPTTLAPLLQNNLKPVFIDIELDSLNFDLELIEEKITPKTKAIFLSPVLGNPPNMDRLLEICKKHSIELLLDNCDSLGSTWRGKYLNEYAIASSTSFYPAHHISTGEGGMVSSNIKEIIKIARSLAWWGRACDCVGATNLLPCGGCGKRFDHWLPDYDGVVDHRYVFTNIGYNLKPLDFQGAIGSVQLEKFEEIEQRRIQSKKRLQGILEEYVEGIKVPNELPEATTCWFGTPIVCPDSESKRSLVEYFEKNKIQTRNYFAGNILLQPAYKHLENAENYPNANVVLDRVFFIGAAPHYHEQIFEYIQERLKARFESQKTNKVLNLSC
ncbi:DegT/DnrJ/EryC1/StrS family aminotransferase [Allocoleopsis franciscana]|uniref:Putative PLP-dependent enzyme possibly involved in cell wall biogenesis n=1 Tax=Allocoleopsis franciscana PCC 7113 TaxID=1173027 RepID=K9W7B7_9CYAN|nr:DegT/DnrJ/EryC1/StrS family aminotransferase [Allocoleopsis franciscana]AFZ16093.1 putative PLP-dependent enzyme possibly involved in cell wall biogenesis [Allocoleopsis franciscana PCC 7113]